jgi:hypothetical protein
MNTMVKHLTSKDVLKKGDSAIIPRITPIDDKALIQADEIELMNPEELFGDSGTDSQQSVAKELFSMKNPKIRSEFTDDEILIMSRLYQLSKKYYEPRGTYLLRDTLNELVILRISKDRGSRKEFVETNREAQKNKDIGLMSRLMGNNQI